MKTLVVMYRNTNDKTKFIDENKSILQQYNVIFVNNTMVNGVDVSMLPD
jgi:hypothetical protein